MGNNQEMLFPTSGIDVSCEFGRQPKGTTPEAENVRTFEPGSNRARGGSRCGMSKFIDDTVTTGAIQHLAVLVTAGEANLQAGVTPPIDVEQFVLDPSDGSRNPGRSVPIGGDAVMLNRNLPANETESPNWFTGTITTSAHPVYFVTLSAGGVTATAVRGTNLPVNTPALLVRDSGSYFFQSNVWFS